METRGPCRREIYIYIYMAVRNGWEISNFVWGGIFSKLEGWFIRFLEWICLVTFPFVSFYDTGHPPI